MDLRNLEELYVGYNNISHFDNYIFLKKLKKLKVVDVRENKIANMEIVRNYFIYHIPTLQVIINRLFSTFW